MLLKFPIGIIQAKLLKRTQRGENHELARCVAALCLIENIRTGSKIGTKSMTRHRIMNLHDFKIVCDYIRIKKKIMLLRLP